MWVRSYGKITLKTNSLRILQIRLTLWGGGYLTVSEKHVPEFMALLPAFPRIKQLKDKYKLRR